MPTSLLDSQLAALEPLQADEAGLVLDIGQAPAELVREILNDRSLSGVVSPPR
jgi:gluconate kinase